MPCLLVRKSLLLPLFLCLVSCNNKKKNVDDDPGKKDRIIKTYRKDGKLFSEITMKDGKRNGVSRNFYGNEKVSLEIYYKDDQKDGLFKQYYEDGTLSKEAEYKQNKLNGITKKYRKDGKMAWQARFSDDNPCAELTEYYLNGTKKTDYPSIIITANDQLRELGDYDLKISMSDKTNTVSFYEGSLTSEGCFDPDTARKIYPLENGVATLSYHLGPGGFLMRELKIVAVVKTNQSNSYITTRSYNLAINN